MLRVIRSLLLKIVDDIDAGNSNISEGEAIEIVDSLKRFTDKEKRLSKYAACEYLNVSRATMENLMTTNPFTFKTSFVGDIEIGGGEIKFNLPLTNKRLVLNMTDLETFKEMLITKD